MAESPEIVIHSLDTSPLGTSQSSSFPLPRSPTPTSSNQHLTQSLSSNNCVVNTSNQASVNMQQNTNMVPNTFPDLMNLQGMVLVLVLTILKLLHYPKFRPKLHYVPAPFPSHPFSNLETTNITTTKPHTDISGKSSVLSSIKKTRCVVWCGKVRGLVQGFVMGCKAGLKEKVNLMRNVSAWLLRVFAGKVMNCATCLANYC